MEKNVEKYENVAKKEDKQEKCEDLRKVVEDVVGFGDGEFLADLGLALVDGLESLTSDFLTQVCNK